MDTRSVKLASVCVHRSHPGSPLASPEAGDEQLWLDAVAELRKHWDRIVPDWAAGTTLWLSFEILHPEPA